VKPTRIMALAILLFPFAALAQDITNDRFTFKVGAFYLEDSDTEIGVRREGAPIGTSVNFQRDLNVDNDVTTTFIGGYYRFNPRHRVDYEWYEFDRDGSRTITRDFTFRDQVYTLGASVKSSIETSVSKLAYTWSFHHTDDVELGFSVGLYGLKYDISVRNQTATFITEESATAPLPLLGFRLDYTINPRWHLLFDTEVFYIEIDDDINGSLNNNSFALEYRPFKHFTFGLGIDHLSIDLQFDDDDLRWNASDFYRGNHFYVGLRF
jgi:hypothetical protein